MNYAHFYSDRYDYLTEGNYILFSTDSTHDDLFNYAATNISSLPELFKQYITSKMNTTTFELKRSTKNDDNIPQIIELLKSAHPYYRHEYKTVIVKAIGEYFNELLIYSAYTQNTLNPELPLQKKWYYDRFSALMPSFIQEQHGVYPDGFYPNDFFDKYRNWIGDKNNDTEEISETFLQVLTEAPYGFSSEITTHKIVCSMLYFILDTTAEGLNNLSTSQRIWFYSNLFYTRNSWVQTHITKHLSYIRPIIYKGNNEDNENNTDNADNDYSQGNKYICEINDMFKPFHLCNDLDIKYENISTLIPESFNSAIEYAKKNGTSEFYEKYEINCLHELLLQEIISMIQSNKEIKKCTNCGKYFISKKSNQKYCHQLFMNTGKPCSQIGRSRNYQKKKKDDPIYQLYQTVYNKRYSRIRKDIPDTMNAFNQWSAEASSRLQKMQQGELSPDEFTKWLADSI